VSDDAGLDGTVSANGTPASTTLANRVLAGRFEEHRGHLRAVGYRMLGSLAEADDAVQEAWVRFSAAGTEGVENLGGWLTTIVTRVCLNMLRARAARPEQPAGVHVPDPIVSRADASAPDPEQEALLADSVGLALLVVLDALSPAERVAFVLHDVFDVPFGEIGEMVGRSEQAARQLASRARRQVRAAGRAEPDVSLAEQRAVVEAFFAAARAGEMDRLIALLDPDVVVRTDAGTGHAGVGAVLRGAPEVATALSGRASRLAAFTPVVVNGAAGMLISARGRPMALIACTVTGGRITTMDAIADPRRLSELGLAQFSPEDS
jgi:RNA polymerase sigma-70 factor (ECF subfamily)